MTLGCGATRGGAVVLWGQALCLLLQEGLSGICQQFPLGEVSWAGVWCAANCRLLA